MAVRKCFMMEHLELSRERRQKRRDSAHIPLPAQAAALVVWASPAGSAMVALAQHPGVRLVPLMVPANSQAYRAQQVGCEALR